jgi:hypothetical protein
MERDEVYVPKTREDLGIPDEQEGKAIDYEEIFGDTPLYTLYMLIRQQFLAFPAYLREFRSLAISSFSMNLSDRRTYSFQRFWPKDLPQMD